MADYKVLDLNLSPQGLKKILWAGIRMPVLKSLVEEFKGEKPLEGVRISACLHITPETANLVSSLKNLGAEVFLAPSNPLSTKDDVAASLVKDFGISVYGIHGESVEEYYENIRFVTLKSPNIVMDDGADLISFIHEKNLWDGIWGGTEETTTGVIRLRAMEREGTLKFPIIAVNDSLTKHLFDNRYGTGQSTVDGILRATNILISNSTVVVAGYGWCGRGIAMRMRGMGARVIVTEVDPIKALEAYEDGFIVMPLLDAIEKADLVVTATGCKDVVTGIHFERIKDGCILCNSGHFDVEIDVKYLYEKASKVEQVRDNLEEITLENGKKVFLIGKGRLVNLVAAEGHPSDVMDLSFSDQLLAVLYILQSRGSLENKVYKLPEDLDRKVAEIKLKTLGVKIDKLTEEQKKYLESWKEGT